jgi:phosphoribosylanthranilate isomerase
MRRVIVLPAIDLRGGKCVRLAQGDFGRETVYDDDPVAVAKRYVDQGAEWLHVVDLDAALEGVPRNRETIAAVIAAVTVPAQVSGGIRDDDALHAAFDAGASRVVLGTAALDDHDFVKMAVERADAIAVGLDVRGSRLQARGWTEEAGDIWEMLDRLNALGVARYIVTDINRDGMMQGPNIDLLVRVMEETEADVIASGGVSSLGDLTALATIGVEGVIVGKALYAGAFTLEQALAVAG